MIDPETDHLMTRAKEEAILAIQARHPAAARIPKPAARALARFFDCFQLFMSRRIAASPCLCAQEIGAQIRCG